MKHCWHSENTILTSDPPQVPQYCCFCGKKRIITPHVYEKVEGHGNYLDPFSARRLIPNPEKFPFEDEECPQRIDTDASHDTQTIFMRKEGSNAR